MPFHKSTMQKVRASKRRRDHELPDTDDDDETVEERVEMAQEPASAAARSSAQNATQGYRGAYHGDLPNQPRFAKRYQEQMLLHSRQTRFLCFDWMNNLGALAQNEANSSFSEQLLFQVAANNQKPYGLSLNADTFWTGSGQIVNPGMAMKVNPINLSVRDIIDTKLLNRWANGERAVYSKFRLLGFKVTIEFTTYNGSSNSHNRFTPEANASFAAGDSEQFFSTSGPPNQPPTTSTTGGGFTTPVSQRIPMKYFVYRDAYLDYNGQNGFINYIGTDLNVGNTSNGMLSQDLANLNNFLEIVNDGESFHFERKINAKAAYFIPPAFFQDSNNTNKPLHVLVAALESLDQQGAIVTPLPEGFHFIFAPINPPFGWFVTNDGAVKHVLYARCYTQAYIKIEADWEAWDFNYNLNDPARMTREGIELAENFNKIADQLKGIRKFTTYSKPLCMISEPQPSQIETLAGEFDSNVQ